MAANPETVLGGPVDSNPVGARRYLNGTNHPVSKEDPASAAESDGNPNEPDEKPRGLPGWRYAGPRRRREALKKP
jgi:hypothetical protein